MSSEVKAVENFREYLRIKTVQPNPDYDGANEFLAKQADQIGLKHSIIKVNDEPCREIFLMTWEGSQPELPTVLLNSHIDVVPVFPEHWTHDPFAAVKDDEGNIFARGSQDMKCVGIQYLEAIRKLKAEGKHFPRTFHLSFVPDEEIGGHLGMEKFIETEDFKKLNIAFSLDEGLANASDAFTLFYGEKMPWWIKVKVEGKPGHGSRFIEDNAGEKLRRIINSFLEYRDKEEAKMNAGNLKLGDVTTVNLTALEGGVQTNVVPAELSVTFDVRITPTQDLKEFEEMLLSWCHKAGQNVTIEFLQKFVGNNLTDASDNNPWWKAFIDTCSKMGIKIEKEIFPAGTDSRYLRKAGLPALGFSPMNNTPILLHDHNEFLNEKVFLRGIDIYCKLLPALANVVIP